MVAERKPGPKKEKSYSLEDVWEKARRATEISQLILLVKIAGSRGYAASRTGAEEKAKKWNILKNYLLLKTAQLRRTGWLPALIGPAQIINDAGEKVERLIFVFLDTNETYVTRTKREALKGDNTDEELDSVLKPYDDVSKYIPEKLKRPLNFIPKEKLPQEADSLMGMLISRLSTSENFLRAAGVDFFSPQNRRNYTMYQTPEHSFSVFYSRRRDGSDELKIDKFELDSEPTIRRYLLETSPAPSITYVQDARNRWYEEVKNTQAAKAAFTGLAEIL